MLGPLAGAAVLAVADWRAIFWLNLLLGVGLAGGRRRRRRAVGPTRSAWSSSSLAAGRSACAGRAGRARRGRHARPAVGAAGRVLDGDDAAGARRAARRSPAVVRAWPCRPGGPAAAGGSGGWPRRSTSWARPWPSSSPWASLVWAFAAADPATQVVAHGWLLLPVAPGRRGVRAARAPGADPVLPAALRPTGAWGALLVNLLVGVALVAALVDIPLFARNTTTRGTSSARRSCCCGC